MNARDRAQLEGLNYQIRQAGGVLIRGLFPAVVDSVSQAQNVPALLKDLKAFSKLCRFNTAWCIVGGSMIQISGNSVFINQHTMPMSWRKERIQ